MSTLLHPEVATEKDFLPLNGTDYVEFYVGNARQSAYFYRLAFGHKLVAYAGPETGQRDRASYVLQQGKSAVGADDAAASGGRDCGPRAEAWRWRDGCGPVGGRCAARPGKRRRSAERRAYASPSSRRTSTAGRDGEPSPPMAIPSTPSSSARTTTAPFCRVIARHPRTRWRARRPAHIDHMVGNVGWNEMNSLGGFLLAT